MWQKLITNKVKCAFLALLFFLIIIGAADNHVIASLTKEDTISDIQEQLLYFKTKKFLGVHHMSIYFYSFNSGEEIKINDGYKYFPASLDKVPIMIAYLKLAQH